MRKRLWTVRHRRLASVVMSMLFAPFLLASAPRDQSTTPTAGPDDSVRCGRFVSLYRQQAITREVQEYLFTSGPQTSDQTEQTMRSCTTVGPAGTWPRIEMVLKIDRAGRVREACGY